MLSKPTALSAQPAMMDNLVQITEFAELKQSVEDLEAKLKEKEEQEDHR